MGPQRRKSRYAGAKAPTAPKPSWEGSHGPLQPDTCGEVEARVPRVTLLPAAPTSEDGSPSGGTPGTSTPPPRSSSLSSSSEGRKAPEVDFTSNNLHLFEYPDDDLHQIPAFGSEAGLGGLPGGVAPPWVPGMPGYFFPDMAAPCWSAPPDVAPEVPQAPEPQQLGVTMVCIQIPAAPCSSVAVHDRIIIQALAASPATHRSMLLTAGRVRTLLASMVVKMVELYGSLALCGSTPGVSPCGHEWHQDWLKHYLIPSSDLDLACLLGPGSAEALLKRLEPGHAKLLSRTSFQKFGTTQFTLSIAADDGEVKLDLTCLLQ